MPDIITNAVDECGFDEMPSNTIVKIIVAALLEDGQLDADKEHVAAAYRQYRNDDTLYTVDTGTIDFSFGSLDYVIAQEDAYEEIYEEMLELYMDDAEYEGRKAIEDAGPYWKFDREQFARDLEYGGERGSIMNSYDGEVYELEWSEWHARIGCKKLHSRETLYFWRTN